LGAFDYRISTVEIVKVLPIETAEIR
jgi:hypothetical protein